MHKSTAESLLGGSHSDSEGDCTQLHAQACPELWITFPVPALHTPSDTRLRPLHRAPEVSVRQREEGDARATSLDFSYWSLAS